MKYRGGYDLGGLTGGFGPFSDISDLCSFRLLFPSTSVFGQFGFEFALSEQRSDADSSSSVYWPTLSYAYSCIVESCVEMGTR